MNPEYDDLEIDNLPNRLTLFRIVLVPIVVGCLFFLKYEFTWTLSFARYLGWIAGWCFVLASITDFFDGYIARKRGIVTVFGSFLDPIADKFLVVASLIMLQELDRLPSLIVIILVLRELYMTSLRLLAMNEGVSVPVSQWGKWKTGAQMIGIPLLMAGEPWMGIPIPLLGIIFIYISCFLSLWSAIKYSMGLIAKLKANRLLKKKRKRGEI